MAPTAPPEQRVMAPRAGGGQAGTDQAPVADTGARRKRLVMLLVGALALGGGAYWFVLKPGEADAATADGHAVEEGGYAAPTGTPGKVLTTEPISINLAGGHYLRLGLGLQLVEGGHGTPDAAPALDLAISLFSGRAITEVTSAEGREALKTELLHQLWETYHGDVLDVYFTDYVTQ